LFNAFLLQRSPQRIGRGHARADCPVMRWCQYRFGNFLIECSRPIFGLGRVAPPSRRFWVSEHVGIAGADDPPAPALVAEQVAAAFADSGDAVLPGQHARPLQRLQRRGDGGAGTAAWRTLSPPRVHPM
jgi:hypothetical protein